MARTSDQIEAEISDIEGLVFSIKDQIAELRDSSASLTANAAVERARNANLGRGIGGALLGSKYRAAARRAAASSNAGISRDVASKRAQISRSKLALQARERELKAHLRDLKLELKHARAGERAATARIDNSTRPDPEFAKPAPAQPPLDVKQELRRLKAAHATGELDAIAYERERIALMEQFLPK